MKFVLKYNYVLLRRLHPRLLVNTSSSSVNRNVHNLGYDTKTTTQESEPKVSTLYVPGRYGGNVYQIVKPLIDVKYIEQNMTQIDESCRLRGIELDLHVALSILKEWTSKHEEQQKILEEALEYEEEVKRLKSLDLVDESEAMNKKWNDCLDQLKILKNNLYDIEDVAMPLVQKIPNVIDTETPLETNYVEVHIEPPGKELKVLSHVEIASALSLLEFSNISPTAYYYKGPLAELDVTAQVYFSDKLQKATFSPMSCVDFCKSFLLEATGLDTYSYDQCIPLKSAKSSAIGQKFNLVGGASFESFCAYLTNMNTDVGTLPAKYFSLGRHYEAGNRHSLSPSLFSVVQSSRIHSIVLSEPANENIEFESLFEVLLSCYLPLKIPFRTVDVAAPRLNCTESRRKQLELWSPAQLQYVPVAYVSKRSDFVSKRLRITYGIQCSIDGYCSIVEGVVVNMPVLLGCIIENYAKTNGAIDFEKVLGLLNSSE